MKNFWYDVATRTAAGGIVALLGVLATTALSIWGSSNFSLQFLGSHQYIIPSFVGVVTFASTCFVASLWYRQKPDLKRVSPDFQVVEKEITLRVESLTDIVYTKRLKLRAKRQGLNKYLDRYHWTGTRVISITCINPAFAYHEIQPKNQWTHYEAIFNRALNKNEIVDLEIRWVLADEENRMKPFLSARVDEPTEKIIFKVQFSRAFGVKELVREVGPDSGTLKPYWTESQPYEEGMKEWIIESPKLMHYYETRWKTQSVTCQPQT